MLRVYLHPTELHLYDCNLQHKLAGRIINITIRNVLSQLSLRSTTDNQGG